MFDRIEALCDRYEELMRRLQEPETAADGELLQRLMKEQSDLAPIVQTYRDYRQAQSDREEALALLDEESDEELRALAKEELASAKESEEDLSERLKILLLPKDPNDEKNVIVEIRAGAGGDEAALFAADLYRMYAHYAERRG